MISMSPCSRLVEVLTRAPAHSIMAELREPCDLHRKRHNISRVLAALEVPEAELFVVIDFVVVVILK